MLTKRIPRNFQTTVGEGGGGEGVIGPGSAFAHDQFVNTEDECML